MSWRARFVRNYVICITYMHDTLETAIKYVTIDYTSNVVIETLSK